ncbi:hypothetical protein ACFWMQ_19570 [Streptomyces sp. NPDC058372]|uniref:hypothetical protein n=1 Tax=Streptomyces sp. NPDC058372 TaxID=3346464 RepID=UPI003655C45E
MEHEVFVPVSAEALRAALRAPATAVRGVPGLQLDPAPGGGAGAEGPRPEGAGQPLGAARAEGPSAEAPADGAGAGSALSGRLRLRLAGRTITYRGALRLTTAADGTYTFHAEGGEVRGTGQGQATVRLRLTPAEGGTLVALDTRARVDGRGARLDEAAVERGMRALLTQAVEALAAYAEQPGGQPGSGPAGEGGSGGAAALQEAPAGESPASGGHGDHGEVGADEAAEPAAAAPGTDEDEITPEELAAAIHSRDGAEDEDEFDEDEVDLDEEVEEIIEVPDIEPAEAAHARRTMIGRSAEEVDHAPPRGRYAPVPVPASSTTSATLRWAAPAAALVVASAVVVGRALRRR